MINRSEPASDSLESLFTEALMLSPSDRNQLFKSRQQEQPDLIENVKRLLDAHIEDDFLEENGPLSSLALIRPPRSIANYDIGEKIGSGGTACVYKGTHKETKQIVAIKLLDPQITRNERHRSQFLKSVRNAKQLQHRCIGNVISAGIENSHGYIVMEYLEGDTLENLIQKAMISQKHAFLIAAEIADGLEYAHSKNIIHRDVKPSNIMIDEEWNVRIIDFGLSRNVGSPFSSSNEPCGTYAYMSPEQERGGEVDGRTDIYSLGLILFELLTGTRVRRDIQERGLSIPKSIHEKCPKVQREVDRVYKKATYPDIGSRFLTAREFGSALRKLAKNQSTGLPPCWIQDVKYLAAKKWTSLSLAIALAIFFILGSYFGVPAIYRARNYPMVKFTSKQGIGSSSMLQYRIQPRVIENAIFVSSVPGRSRIQPGFCRFVNKSPEGFGEWALTIPEGGSISLHLDIPIIPTSKAIKDMVLIPAGPFIFGAEKMNETPYYEETVYLQAFYIDPTEVSNGDYAEFLAATNNDPPSHWSLLKDLDNWEELPIVGVSWREASLFARWKGKRLPTIYELQRVARGLSGNKYPWGNIRGEIKGRAVLWQGSSIPNHVDFEGYKNNVLAVTAQSKADQSEDGILHTLGNVEEWAETPRLVFRWPGGSFELGFNYSERAVHGFSWAYPSEREFISFKSIYAAPLSAKSFDRGFRCAKSAPFSNNN